MKIVNFSHQGLSRLGVMDGDNVVDLTMAAPELPADLIALINLGDAGFAAAKKAAANAAAAYKKPFSSLTLLPPIPRLELIVSRLLLVGLVLLTLGLASGFIYLLTNRDRYTLAPDAKDRKSTRLNSSHRT